MSHFIALIFVLLLILLMIVLILRSRPVYEEDEYEETTTTVTHEEDREEIKVVGNVTKLYKGKQPYVIDPADGEDIFVNSTDDLYEDAIGRVWKLV